MANRAAAAALLSGRRHYPRPSPIPRPSPVAYPPGSYDRLPLNLDLNEPIPKLLYKGNFCGVRVPGIPILPGMSGYTVDGWRDNAINSGKNPVVMALDVPRYINVSWDLVQEGLNAHAIRGLTHLQCDLGHAISYGLTRDQWLKYLGMVQDIVGFADVWFLGGGPFAYDPGDPALAQHRDQGADWWAPKFQPWIDAMLANKLIDCACVGWQLDAYNTHSPRPWCKFDNPFQSIVDYFADQLAPHDIPIGTHWINEAGVVFGDTFLDRFTYWQMQRNRLTWFHQQGDPRISVPDYQAKLVDVIDPFGDGRMGTSGLFGDRPFAAVVYECSGQDQFDMVLSDGVTPNPFYITEDEGDLRNMLLVSTKGKSKFGGVGNGWLDPKYWPTAA